MKSKSKSVISLILVAVMIISAFALSLVFFTGCGDDGEASTDNITYSNGGSVVEYGDYIYFINGVGGYPTSENLEDVNVAGDVKKGGLYRVKKHQAILKEYELSATDPIRADYKKHENIDFESSELDWFDLRDYTISDTHDVDDDGNLVPHFDYYSEQTEFHVTGDNVKMVVGKIIGTGNYPGGIYIFDDRIYFASPSNSLNKDGKYAYDKVDFFTCNLDGSNLTKLYTTTGTIDEPTKSEDDETGESEATNKEGDITSIPYHFTKQNNRVYLSTFEHWYANSDDEVAKKKTGYVVTTEIINGLVDKQVIAASSVIGVHFPIKETYDPDASTNTLYDFIYIVRAADTINDNNTRGSVIEMMRPNGEDREVIINNNKTASIEGVSGDYFYYRNNFSNSTTLEYTNLRAQLVNSSYEKIKNKDGDMVIKYDTDKDGNKTTPVRKKGGKTFLDEQEALSVGQNGYIYPMTETSHILVSNINDTSRAYSSFFLVPQNAKDASAVAGVFVIGLTDSGVYNVSKYSANVISDAAFTPLVTDGEKLYGYNSENNFGYMYVDAKKAAANRPKFLQGDYTSVSNNTYLMMDLVTVHNDKGGLVDTYCAYFTNYPTSEKATNYMAMMKVNGKYCGESTGPTPVAYVLPSEKRQIVCYDPDCIDYTHNHTERDGFEPGVDPNAEEEGGEEGAMM